MRRVRHSQLRRQESLARLAMLGSLAALWRAHEQVSPASAHMSTSFALLDTPQVRDSFLGSRCGGILVSLGRPTGPLIGRCTPLLIESGVSYPTNLLSTAHFGPV